MAAANACRYTRAHRTVPNSYMYVCLQALVSTVLMLVPSLRL